MTRAADLAPSGDPRIRTNHQWRPVVRKGEPTMADMVRLAAALLAPALIVGLLFASLLAVLPLVPLVPLAVVATRWRGRVTSVVRVSRPPAALHPPRSRLALAGSHR